MILLVGIALMAVGIVAFVLAKARGDVSKFSRPWVEQVLSLAIVCSTMIGLVVTFIGIGRL